MKLKSLQCPGCGGMLEIEDGLDIFYCKYCGYKVVLSGQSKAAYDARTRVKELQYEQAAQERKYINDVEKWKRQEITEKNRFKRDQIDEFMTWIPFFIYLLIFLSPIIFGEIKHFNEERELQKIVERIEEDIDEGDYDHALLLTNKLRIENGWFSFDSKEWEERRADYVRTIRKKQEKESDYKFIRSPLDSDDCSDYTKSEMMDLFSEAGFENVDTEKVKGSAGVFKKKHTVEHVSVDGVSEFTKKDKFVEDADIVIYYYEK